MDKLKPAVLFENRIGRCKKNGLDSFLTPHEVADYLNVSRRFVYERIASRDLEFQFVGRLRRIRFSTLEAWLIRQQNGELK